MLWLPPNYRILYSTLTGNYDEDSIETLKSFLNNYIQQGSLFCFLENDLNIVVGMVTDFAIENERIKFLIIEKRPNSFIDYNIHLEKYEVMIDIEGHMIGDKIRIERVSNRLMLKEKA